MADFLNVWLPVVTGVVPVLITIISFIIPFVKNAKAKKALETAIKIAEAVQPFIVEAEKFVNYKGEEKLNFVMTKANQFAIDHNLKFDTEAVKAKIEELVTLTKQVNQRDKDKTTTYEKKN